jgi:hypothetical protein
MAFIYMEDILEKEFEDTLVFSSHLTSIGYDVDIKVLRISFYEGSTYEYFEVPKSIWERFIKVQSKGKFFHRNIRNIYSYAKIN